MVEIRCKFCKGLAARVNDKLSGTISLKGAKYKRVIEITYPRREDRAIGDESAAAQNV